MLNKHGKQARSGSQPAPWLRSTAEALQDSCSPSRGSNEASIREVEANAEVDCKFTEPKSKSVPKMKPDTQMKNKKEVEKKKEKRDWRMIWNENKSKKERTEVEVCAEDEARHPNEEEGGEEKRRKEIDIWNKTRSRVRKSEPKSMSVPKMKPDTHMKKKQQLEKKKRD